VRCKSALCCAPRRFRPPGARPEWPLSDVDTVSRPPPSFSTQVGIRGEWRSTLTLGRGFFRGRTLVQIVRTYALRHFTHTLCGLVLETSLALPSGGCTRRLLDGTGSFRRRASAHVVCETSPCFSLPDPRRSPSTSLRCHRGRRTHPATASRAPLRWSV
jgi:hypothetical protein